ncbi:hypothetical protein KZ847_29655 [Pseudomonas aeruginosa]|nr:hypothetical protein [Pseudomonas aeruginosa]MBW6134525.1 hypothetical protein [Pseudomonas aeruginosa]
MGQRNFLRQPVHQQPLRAQQYWPVSARALQHKSQAQAEGKEQRRQLRALYQMQADAPQAEPRGGENKKAGSNGD